MVLKIIRRLFFKQKQKNTNCFISSSAKISIHSFLLTNMGGEIHIGNNTEILHGVTIMTYGGSVRIGDNCSINPYAILYGHGGLVIGNNVLIAGHTMLIPANHIFENPNDLIRKQGESKLGIFVEDDVWIASGCTILDGVRIGRGSVVAAGSVVNKDIPPNSVVAGVPAKLIKQRSL